MKDKIFLYSLILSILIVVVTAIGLKPYVASVINVPFSTLAPEAKKQITCLAENIYFEAAHEPLEGKKAVAFVTFNRLQTGNYANTICGVVQQKTGEVCQFSWFCESKTLAKRSAVKETSLYTDILELSVKLYLNFENYTDVTNGSTHYHADYVNPGWKLTKEKQIGRHIFYKNKGDRIDRTKEII